LWAAYFAHASVTGIAWEPKGFVPVFQDGQVLATERLVRDSTEAYPRLSDLAIGITAIAGAPAVELKPVHPYAIGGAWNGEVITVQGRQRFARALDREPGEHRAALATLTPYGPLASRELRWTAA
jgi:hypothetical protein